MKMKKSEFILRICCMVMCFVPLGAWMLIRKVEMSMHARHMIGWGICLANAILVLTSFKVYKDTKNWVKVIGILTVIGVSIIYLRFF